MKLRSILFAGACAAAAPAHSAVVYDAPRGLAGNQNYSDNLGLDFRVNGSIAVTALGAYDDQPEGIFTNIQVGIYDLDDNMWAIPLLSFQGAAATGASAYVFKSIAPVWLNAGNYSVIGRGFNVADLNFNTNLSGQNNNSPITFDSLGGRLTNVQSRYGGGLDPEGNGSVVFAPKSAFAAGSFQAAAVPEPATWMMMIAGFGAVGFAMRRNRLRKVKFA